MVVDTPRCHWIQTLYVYKIQMFFKKERTKIICLTCCIFVSFIQTTLYNHHTQKSKLLPLNVINMGWAIKLKGFCWTIWKRLCIVSWYLHFVCTPNSFQMTSFCFFIKACSWCDTFFLRKFTQWIVQLSKVKRLLELRI